MAKEYLDERMNFSRPLNELETKIHLGEVYETKMGLFNHFVKGVSPLASVEMHPFHDLSKFSTFADVLVEYDELQIKDLWGLSLKEFLSYPTHRTKMIREISRELLANRKKVTIPGLKDDK